ncbi:F-box protein At3g07870-like [Papaver somniferum]|uniref:F-box protein At3g07870-like n=1 Tax=Papaver somniferum TaxID=3469 RepID=UPI000E6FDDD3|nr:F-box protein At3g07870-like [Papaver somniferum]
MKNLHHDIILNILSRLPYQCIINCKLVCKRWRDLLSNIKAGLVFKLGSFRGRLYYGGEEYCDDINIHEKEYSYETLPEMDNLYPLDDQLEPLRALGDLVGSCNGLVCLKIFDLDAWVQDSIYICNPVTREYIYLPKYIYGDGDSHHRGYFVCGFGYSYSTDEYKVVRMYRRYGNFSDVSSKVQVYTLGSGQGWRDKGRLDHLLCPSSPGVCANGALYWSGFGKIVSFDLAKEEFRIIPLPPIPSKKKLPVSPCLRLLRGYLSAIKYTRGEERTFLRIWELKKKSRCTNSAIEEPAFDDLWYWNEELSFSWENTGTMDRLYLPFAVTNSNQVLLWCGGFLFYYDLHTTNLTKLWGEDWLCSNKAIPHVNSLVSMKALGEKSKKRI